MKTESKSYQSDSTTDVGGSSSLTRRAVIIGGASALGALLVGAPVQQLVASTGGAVSASVGASGLASLLPGAGGFRYYTVTGGYPLIKTAKFNLAVDGLVDKPFNLDFEQLNALPQTEIVSEFQCVTGWIVPNVRWRGVALADILRMANVAKQTDSVEFYSSDGVYTESLTMSQAMNIGAIVATSMNGAPVTQAHGGPVRLYVPKMYGYKSIKWLARISVVKTATAGYWEQRGYPIDAYIGSGGL